MCALANGDGTPGMYSQEMNMLLCTQARVGSMCRTPAKGTHQCSVPDLHVHADLLEQSFLRAGCSFVHFITFNVNYTKN